jgi:hypothetical protein
MFAPVAKKVELGRLEQLAVDLKGRAAALDWKRERPNAFVLGDAGKAALRIDNPRDKTVRLTVLDATGEAIESIQTEPERSGAWRDWEVALNATYELARDKATGIDGVLKGIRSDHGLPAR